MVPTHKNCSQVGLFLRKTVRHVNSQSMLPFLGNVLVGFNLAFLFRLSERGIFRSSGEWGEERDLE